MGANVFKLDSSRSGAPGVDVVQNRGPSAVGQARARGAMTRIHILIALCACLVGCHRAPAEGRFVCATAQDCPTGWVCRPDNFCWSTASQDDGGFETSVRDAGADAASSPITAVVHGADGTAFGFHVLFHDRDGNVLDQRVTDATGTAVSDVEGIDALTVINPGSPFTILITVTALQPGTVFNLDNRVMAPQRAVVLPGAFAGAAYYEVSGQCGAANGFDATIPLMVCDDGSGEIAALAMDSSNRALAYAHQVSPGTGEVALSAWATDFRDVAVSYVNTPAGQLSTRVTSAPLDSLQLSDFGSDPSVVRVVPNFAGVYRTSSTVAESSGGHSQTVSVERDDAPIPSAMLIDFADAPGLQNLSADRSNPSRPQVSWTVSGGQADLTSVTLSYPGVLWSTLLSGDRVTVRVPALPDEYASLRPVAALDSYSISRSNYSRILSYDELLSRGPTTFGSLDGITVSEHGPF
jgi:hypothetical protein